MSYNKTAKIIVLIAFLIIIGFAIGLAWKLNQTATNQRHSQLCADYQQSLLEGDTTAANPGCNSK